ncbi:MAG TPA: phosphotransferase [Candidatus Saccharimonadales bacterium]|nr:phosphotransferase [Candidatus Saccharimonadales bacterium]
MDREVIATIAAAYGLQPERILPMQKGYRNKSFAMQLPSGSMVNLVIYKTEPGILARIQHANAVSNAVATHNLPARHTADPRILQLKPGTYASLYNYLPGRTIPWEAYTMDHLKQLGKTMGDMHAALTGFEGNLPSIAHECLALNTRMQRYFAQPQVAKALKHKLTLRLRLFNADKLLAQCAALPQQQALHMDFVRGNLLFNDEPIITGILDFEKTARGHVLFDIARTLAFLLVDCKYKSEQQIRKYFLLSGYQKRSQANLPNAPALLEQLVTFFLIHDFYKFLRHNPYESLPQNEHFTRTRNLLQAQHIIE